MPVFSDVSLTILIKFPARVPIMHAVYSDSRELLIVAASPSRKCRESVKKYGNSSMNNIDWTKETEEMSLSETARKMSRKNARRCLLYVKFTFAEDAPGKRI